MQKINWKNNTISKLCLGTVQFGLDYGIANTTGQVTETEAHSIMDYILSQDINCIDTAQGYGNSEFVIGKFFQKHQNKNIKIISKIKSDIFQLSSSNFIKNIRTSLNTLSTESIFGLLLHDNELLYDWNTNHSSYVKSLKALKFIQYFGVSIYTNEEFLAAMNNSDIDIVQIPFNLFDQRAITNGWLQKAKEKNKLIFIRSVYLQGLILMDEDKIPIHLNKAKKYINLLDKLTTKLGITRNELALSFINTMAKDSIILFGCDSLEQAKENLSIFSTLPKLNKYTIDYIQDNFSNTSENIYNPSHWKK